MFASNSKKNKDLHISLYLRRRDRGMEEEARKWRGHESHKDGGGGLWSDGAALITSASLIRIFVRMRLTLNSFCFFKDQKNFFFL